MALIHRWPLTSGPEDVVGWATLTNNGSVAFSAAGALFNASEQWLWRSSFNMTTTGTVSLWVRPTDYNARDPFGWSSSNYPYSESYLGFNASGDMHLYFWGGYNSNVWPACFNSSNFPSDILKNLMYAWDSESAYAYVNGICLGSVNKALIGGSNYFAIGGPGGKVGVTTWRGWIADFRLYDSILTVGEMESLIDAGVNGDPASVVDKPRLILSRPPLPAVLSCLPVSLSRGFR